MFDIENTIWLTYRWEKSDSDFKSNGRVPNSRSIIGSVVLIKIWRKKLVKIMKKDYD